MLAAVSTVCASAVWMAVEMAATWWVRKVLGDARPCAVLRAAERHREAERVGTGWAVKRQDRQTEFWPRLCVWV